MLSYLVDRRTNSELIFTAVGTTRGQEIIRVVVVTSVGRYVERSRDVVVVLVVARFF